MQELENKKIIKWIKPPQEFKIQKPFIQAQLIGLKENNKYLCRINYENIIINKEVKVLEKDIYQKSTQMLLYDDMCKMNVLNQPEILNNLVEKYRKNQIFCQIGPTLIIMNPNQYLKQYFDQSELQKHKQNILRQNDTNSKPHIFNVGGRAYNQMKISSKKQAIVISGQSGAGKTQSTKYCLKILTSLSDQGHKEQIQQKILSCDPILQAFGNSKTIKNDNSSRFGKYIQIYFDHNHHIKGANIKSYLLQKSRVISLCKGQRNFHAFYALLGSQKFNTLQPKQYNFLKQSQCYHSQKINDKQYFNQINKSMIKIGFKQNQINKIWNLLKSILDLGNIEFNDEENKHNQNLSCRIVNQQLLRLIAECLEINWEVLGNVLVKEKRVLPGQVIYKSYNKQGCINNRNTLCKALYNNIFQFILQKIQQSLYPKQQAADQPFHYKFINILDIFGFENFDNNSIQQLCINFTNEKLLKLYNEYIFQNQIKALKDDGLQQSINPIKCPTNDELIKLLNKNIFLTINDYSSLAIKQDKDIQQKIEIQLKNSKLVRLQKVKSTYFTIIHSPCQIKYNTNGFKMKNLDRINNEIMEVVNNLPVIRTKIVLKQQKGKTLLKKFSSQIQTLIKQLSQSTVHFVRCIKPNQIKTPNNPNQKYILKQSQYLGIFQSIQIRKSTFPIRITYHQFYHEYKILYENHQNDLKEKEFTEILMERLKFNRREYQLGNNRVYMNEEIQKVLNRHAQEVIKTKQCLRRMKRLFKDYVIRLIKNIAAKTMLQKIFLKLAKKHKMILKNAFIMIKQNAQQLNLPIIQKIQQVNYQIQPLLQQNLKPIIKQTITHEILNQQCKIPLKKQFSSQKIQQNYKNKYYELQIVNRQIQIKCKQLEKIIQEQRKIRMEQRRREDFVKQLFENLVKQHRELKKNYDYEKINASKYQNEIKMLKVHIANTQKNRQQKQQKQRFQQEKHNKQQKIQFQTQIQNLKSQIQTLKQQENLNLQNLTIPTTSNTHLKLQNSLLTQQIFQINLIKKSEQQIKTITQQIQQLKFTKNKYQQHIKQLHNHIIKSLDQYNIDDIMEEVQQIGKNNQKLQEKLQEKQNFNVQIYYDDKSTLNRLLKTIQNRLAKRKEKFNQFKNQIKKQSNSTFDQSVIKNYLQLFQKYKKQQLHILSIKTKLLYVQIKIKQINLNLLVKQEQTIKKQMQNNYIIKKQTDNYKKNNNFEELRKIGQDKTNQISKVEINLQSIIQKNIKQDKTNQISRVEINLQSIILKSIDQHKINQISRVEINLQSIIQQIQLEQSKEQIKAPRRATCNIQNRNNHFNAYRNRQSVNEQNQQQIPQFHKIKKQLSLNKQLNQRKTVQILNLQKQNKTLKDKVKNFFKLVQKQKPNILPKSIIQEKNNKKKEEKNVIKKDRSYDIQF